MASSAELRQICEELSIDSFEMSNDEMTIAVRKEFDRKYSKRRFPLSADRFSETLRKFMTEEYDYVMFDKDKRKLNYNYSLKE